MSLFYLQMSSSGLLYRVNPHRISSSLLSHVLQCAPPSYAFRSNIILYLFLITFLLPRVLLLCRIYSFRSLHVVPRSLIRLIANWNLHRSSHNIWLLPRTTFFPYIVFRSNLFTLTILMERSYSEFLGSNNYINGKTNLLTKNNILLHSYYTS